MKLASIFTDGMIFQRDSDIKIFGSGDGHASVDFLGIHSEADSDGGRWIITLPGTKAGGPYEITVYLNGVKTLLSDVYIGDVWLMCGQSNIEQPLIRTDGGIAETVSAYDPNIRFFTVPRRHKSDTPVWGHHFYNTPNIDTPWRICDASTAANFSAIGYYFAKEIRSSQNIPIGVIECNWGGTRIETWIPETEFVSPVLADEYKKYKDACDALNIDEYEAGYADYRRRAEAYFTSFNSDKNNIMYRPAAAAEYQIAWPAALPYGPYDPNRPAHLYDSMVSRLIPFGVKGVIWYQGESNTNLPDNLNYADKYKIMMSAWRRAWGIDIPFYAFELAPFKTNSWKSSRHDESWAYIREQQLFAADENNLSYLAPGGALGDVFDIHPTRKYEAAYRLASLAKKYSYNLTVPVSAPRYRSMEINGNEILISVDNNEGLLVSDRGFYIAGTDNIFRPASARLKDGRIAVSRDGTDRPINVRYAFYNDYTSSVFNYSGLPLHPFRTDSLEWDKSEVIWYDD